MDLSGYNIKIAYPFQQTFLDYPDNYSTCVICYFIGCPHSCQFCHNKEFNLNSQYRVFKNVKMYYNYLIIVSRKCKTNKLVLSGGQPLQHIQFIKQFLAYNKYFDVCIYTGYDIQFVKENNITGFKYIKCGQYDYTNKQQQVKFDQFMTLASTNQNFYDSEYNKISENGILKFMEDNNDTV